MTSLEENQPKIPQIPEPVVPNVPVELPFYPKEAKQYPKEIKIPQTGSKSR